MYNTKMSRRHSKFGFTVLELIIVIIVVGIITALAIPRLFRLIERSRAAEALANISAIRKAMEFCGADQLNTTHGPEFGNYMGCEMDCGGGPNSLMIENPSSAPGSHFDYHACWMGIGSGDTFKIEAIRNGRNGGDNGVSGIYYEVASGPPGTRNIWYEGYGVFDGIKQGGP